MEIFAVTFIHKENRAKISHNLTMLIHLFDRSLVSYTEYTVLLTPLTKLTGTHNFITQVIIDILISSFHYHHRVLPRT